MAITKTMLEFGLEPVEKDWGTGKSGMGDGNFSPFERINRLRKEFLDTPHTIDDQRALIWTETMKGNLEKPYIVRCAEAFREVLKNVPIRINDNLVFGEPAAPPRRRSARTAARTSSRPSPASVAPNTCSRR